VSFGHTTLVFRKGGKRGNRQLYLFQLEVMHLEFRRRPVSTPLPVRWSTHEEIASEHLCGGRNAPRCAVVMKVQSCSGGRPSFPYLALALLSLSLTLQAVPATHEFDGQRQDCAAGSWGVSLLDSRASAVTAVRLPCPMLREAHVWLP
jgi:hypothetical protein